MKPILILTVLSVFRWAEASVFATLDHPDKEENLSPKYRSFVHDVGSSYAKKRIFGFKPKIVNAAADEVGHRLVIGAQRVLDLIDGSQGGTTEPPTVAPPTTDIPTEVPTAPPTTDTETIFKKKEYLSGLLDILRDIKTEGGINRRRSRSVDDPGRSVDELRKDYKLIQEIGHIILSMGSPDGPGGADDPASSEEY